MLNCHEIPKLQNAIKSNTRLIDGEQYLGSVQPQVQGRSIRLQLDPTKTHAIGRSLPQLDYSELKHLPSISTTLPNSPHSRQKTVGKNSK